MSRVSPSILEMLKIGRRADLRFRKKIDRSAGVDGCWPFMGGRNKRGYGIFDVSRDYKETRYGILAHRIAWALESGRDVPADRIVCHHCDNPSCCNPRHLYLGTHQTNSDDKVRRGRLVAPLKGIKGASHPASKYTAEQRSTAVEMRRRSKSFGEISEAVGCNRSTAAKWWNEYVESLYKPDPKPKFRVYRGSLKRVLQGSSP